MKEKIELNQSDMIVMLVEKINFLTAEYRKLHGSFKYEKGKTETDSLKVAESYQRFLGEEGDINRLLKFYELFKTEQKDNNSGGPHTY